MIQSLKTLEQLIPELDWDKLRQIANVKQPVDTQQLNELRQRAVQEYPGLSLGTDPSTLNLEQIAFKSALKTPAEFGSEDTSNIADMTTHLKTMFPERTHVIEQRVCSPKQFAAKQERVGTRAFFDIVGFQVVPKIAADIARVAESIKEIDSWQVLFVFNTMLFSDEDFKNFIGPTSNPHYRAIHYYLACEGICVEIQVRPPATHAWSRLHHATIYKPQVVVDEEIQKQIEELGAAANYLDYLSILR